MYARKSKSKSLLVVAAVFALMLCSFAVVAESSDAADSNSAGADFSDLAFVLSGRMDTVAPKGDTFISGEATLDGTYSHKIIEVADGAVISAPASGKVVLDACTVVFKGSVTVANDLAVDFTNGYTVIVTVPDFGKYGTPTLFQSGNGTTAAKLTVPAGAAYSSTVKALDLASGKAFTFDNGTTSFTVTGDSDAAKKEVAVTAEDTVTVLNLVYKGTNAGNVEFNISSAGIATMSVKGDVKEVSISSATADKIEVPQATFQNIASKAQTGEKVELTLSVKTNTKDQGAVASSVTFDTEALKGVAVTGPVSLTIDDSKDNLPAAQKEVIGDKKVINIKLTGMNTDFGNGKATVSVPLTLDAGKSAKDIIVFFVDDNGNKTQLDSGAVSFENGSLSFTTSHFSVYMVDYAQSPSPSTSSSIVSLVVALIVGSVVIGAVTYCVLSATKN